MADNTGAPHFIPYVEPTDLVREYPAADEASAFAVAAALDAIPVLAGIGSNVVQTVKTDVFSSSSTTYTEVLAATITPSTASSKILVVAQLSVSGSGAPQARLSGGNTSTYVGDAAGTRNQNVFGLQTSNFRVDLVNISQTIVFLDSPASAAATTYKVEMLTDPGIFFLNRSSADSDSKLFGRGASSLTLIEVAA